MAIEPGADMAMYRSSAPVRVRQYTAKERDHLLSILHSRVDSSVFEGDDAPVPFFFRVEASNQSVDSYFTRMSKSSLKNYAQDATDPGVQFQVSHFGGGGLFGGGEVGFGRSLEGKFIARSENPATAIDFYTIPGLTCGNMTSDQFITGARSGIYADVSIGFTPGAFICNICGGDMLARWDSVEESCLHYPGITYDVKKGSKTERVLCIADVEDGHLNEVSTVYDGATPGAGILAIDMARMAAAHGRLKPLDHQLIENVYRVKIDLPARIHGGIDMTGATRTATTTVEEVVETTDTTDPKLSDAANRTVAEAENQNPSGNQGDEEEPYVPFVAEEREENESETETRAVEPMERLRRKYEGTGVNLHRDPYRSIEGLADLVLAQHGEIRELRKDAADGRAYRESLLTRLDESVVRAFGAEVAEEKQTRYRRLAKNEDAAGVEELIADLELKAGERFKSGRATRDDVTSGAEEVETPADRTPKRRGPTPARLVL
jgi:hypothetical protein